MACLQNWTGDFVSSIIYYLPTWSVLTKAHYASMSIENISIFNLNASSLVTFFDSKFKNSKTHQLRSKMIRWVASLR